jgi:hypothetical protein
VFAASGSVNLLPSRDRENVPIKIKDFFILVDFIVLDMEGPLQVKMVREVRLQQEDTPGQLSMESLLKIVEFFAIRKKKRHDRYHARRRVSRKTTLEEQARQEVESTPHHMRKVG